MARKFQRNTLEDAFKKLSELRGRVDDIVNNKEKSLPFRDKENFPPGVEGQIVLATYIPPLPIFPLAPCSTHPVNFGVSATGPMVYSGDRAFPEYWPSDPDRSWFQIYKCNATDSETRANPDHRENQSIAALNHDYTKIAYMAADQYNEVDDGLDSSGWPESQEHLRVCTISGTGAITLDTWGSSSTDPSSPEMLVWSPDGTKVAANDDNGNLYVYPINGDPRVTVNATSNGYSPPSWSHDSQYVFYNGADNSIVRRKWDASDSEVVFLDGTVYGSSASFMIHPHDPILVFNYYESDASDPDDNRALGFLNVAAPGCTPEFITWGDLSAAGIWNTPYGTIEDTYLMVPTWSPDGRYVLSASEEYRTITAPHDRTWKYLVFDRDLTFTATWSIFNTAGTASVINDLSGAGYRQQYPPTWVSFSSSTQRVAGEESSNFMIDYSQYPLPSGPLTPLVRSDPDLLLDAPSGMVEFRQLGSGTWYPSWCLDWEGKYYS